jgi:hypothetical protein
VPVNTKFNLKLLWTCAANLLVLSINVINMNMHHATSQFSVLGYNCTIGSNFINQRTVSDVPTTIQPVATGL